MPGKKRLITVCISNVILCCFLTNNQKNILQQKYFFCKLVKRVFFYNHPKFQEVKSLIAPFFCLKILSRFYAQVYLADARFYFYLRVKLDEKWTIIYYCSIFLKHKDNGKWHLLSPACIDTLCITHIAACIPSPKRYLSYQIIYIIDLQKS